MCMGVARRFGSGHRILVTGGAGFVPSHIVDELLARGATVVAIDNFVTGSKENVAHLADHPAFTLIEADLAYGLPADPTLDAPFDAILHCTAPASRPVRSASSTTWCEASWLCSTRARPVPSTVGQSTR